MSRVPRQPSVCERCFLVGWTHRGDGGAVDEEVARQIPQSSLYPDPEIPRLPLHLWIHRSTFSIRPSPSPPLTQMNKRGKIDFTGERQQGTEVSGCSARRQHHRRRVYSRWPRVVEQQQLALSGEQGVQEYRRHSVTSSRGAWRNSGEQRLSMAVNWPSNYP